ncbi:MAG: DNA-binding response regulator [Chloroflexi bacterium]|nr:MAG: DNA-binding response regulator [Chloroflexota bacterium]
MTIRVLLVDDHPVVREGLRLVIQRDPRLSVAGESATREAALEAARSLRPDVIVLDVALGSEDGVPLIEALRACAPDARVLVLSMYDDAETVRQSLLAGAAGYLVKGASSEELLTAIGAVAHGGRFLHSSIAGVVIEDGLRWLREGATLTPREREVVSLFADGQTASRIGGALGISVHTVRRHLANSAQKLGVQGRHALVSYAQDHGFARAGLRRSAASSRLGGSTP